MPVNDTTVEWPEKLSPFVTVGQVHVPRQDISGTESLEKTDAPAFNQWRAPEEHTPRRGTTPVRPLYTAAATLRPTPTNQPQTETARGPEAMATTTWKGPAMATIK